VSVCIPTCNRADYLRQAIESVLGQSFSDYELIVSDNASNDSTGTVIKSFDDDRIVYIRKEIHVGLVENWNSCLAAAKGEYINIFHDDDIMMPENLALKVAVLDKHQEVGIVHSNFNIIDENGQLKKIAAHFFVSNDFIECGRIFLKKSLLGFNPINPPSAVIRKECYQKLGGFSNRVYFTTDWEYWMRISMFYDVGFLSQPLIRYRMYHQNAWTSSQYMTFIEGDIFSNLKGLDEEYVAKKIILKQGKAILIDWSKIYDQVIKKIIRSINFLIDNQYLRHGKKYEAIEEIYKINRKFPELLFQLAMVKLIAKILIGTRLTEIYRKIHPIRGNS
jgi:glycosyltransferase involved in cell wall biosynthesis